MTNRFYIDKTGTIMVARLFIVSR